jgi:hypothetical protein
MIESDISVISPVQLDEVNPDETRDAQQRRMEIAHLLQPLVAELPDDVTIFDFERACKCHGQQRISMHGLHDSLRTIIDTINTPKFSTADRKSLSRFVSDIVNRERLMQDWVHSAKYNWITISNLRNKLKIQKYRDTIVNKDHLFFLDALLHPNETQKVG